jgi:hypothetical protein
VIPVLALITALLVGLPAAAQPPDWVAQLVSKVKQADQLVAKIREAVANRDWVAVRLAATEYGKVIRAATDDARKLSPANPGTKKALEIVREATLKQMAALQRALEAAPNDEARAALERAMMVSETGHNVAAAALEQASQGLNMNPAGTGGPPAGFGPP